MNENCICINNVFSFHYFFFHLFLASCICIETICIDNLNINHKMKVVIYHLNSRKFELL